ncbi:Glycine rich protein [Desmophyllum pertusum]|uniref:Glycine rich protein n=1 Tax=Desmophyllum pertusum TaxID=174260 RepID=A0A9W9ZX04_9CNID|nr:Glycine rich protein [Desmophyllum pertusum]
MRTVHVVDNFLDHVSVRQSDSVFVWCPGLKVQRMPGFTSYLLILLFSPYIQSFYSNDDFRSSYLSIWDDHVLLGHVTAVHPARGITSCAQGCLSKPGCLSFNFGKDLNRCELNNSSSQSLKHHKDFTQKRGFVHGHWITIPVMQFVFTTLDAQGPTGPKNTSGYSGTLLEGQVQLNNGIQEWTVPYTGTYVVEAFGASGANGTCTGACSGWRRGGLGAKSSVRLNFSMGKS